VVADRTSSPQASPTKTGRYCYRGLLATALCTLAGFAGCGGSTDARVSGVVTLDGQVVPRGMVSFQPKAGGPVAIGPIEADGSYVLGIGRDTRLPSGEYDVTVRSNEPPAATRNNSGGPPPAGKPITPLWYLSKETSGLSFTVTPGNNKVDLELTTEPPSGWNRPSGGSR
jgi:hypothetical protein